MEIWRDIAGWKGFYQVSNTGRVRSLTRVRMLLHPTGKVIPRKYRGRLLKAGTTKKGYLLVVLSKSKFQHSRPVHKLVAEAFIGRCPKNKEVCHNDGIKKNNHVRNLRYDTSSANSQDYWRSR